MPWFERIIKITFSVDATDAEDAEDRMTEEWQFSQPFGFGVELGPEGREQDKFTEIDV